MNNPPPSSTSCAASLLTGVGYQSADFIRYHSADLYEEVPYLLHSACLADHTSTGHPLFNTAAPLARPLRGRKSPRLRLRLRT